MNAAGRTANRWIQFVALLFLFFYCGLLLVQPPSWLPTVLQGAVRTTQASMFGLISDSIKAISGRQTFPRELSSAIYFVLIAAVLPISLARIAGRGLNDLGWRLPNRLAARYFIVALIIGTPFLLWMVNSPTIGRPYLNQFHRLGFLAFAAFYLVNMFTEHLFLHGFVLAFARPDRHWPPAKPVPPPAKGLVGVLRWLGFGTATNVPTSEKRIDEIEDACQLPAQKTLRTTIDAWLGLAPSCLIPMVFSAFLFGLVHLGKDKRELILAFPGGLAQAYIAYRSNSWFTPFLIHLATASAALLMMMWIS